MDNASSTWRKVSFCWRKKINGGHLQQTHNLKRLSPESARWLHSTPRLRVSGPGLKLRRRCSRWAPMMRLPSESEPSLHRPQAVGAARRSRAAEPVDLRARHSPLWSGAAMPAAGRSGVAGAAWRRQCGRRGSAREGGCCNQKSEGNLNSRVRGSEGPGSCFSSLPT